ncbi:hypothetical protein JW906_09305 [bacterium]|nr:hypothetical protein [bacterium]
MIPRRSHPKWEALVKGDIRPNFKVFSGNMMLSQLSRSIRNDDSEGNIKACIDKAYAFFTRFEQLFSAELNRIFR